MTCRGISAKALCTLDATTSVTAASYPCIAATYTRPIRPVAVCLLLHKHHCCPCRTAATVPPLGSSRAHLIASAAAVKSVWKASSPAYQPLSALTHTAARGAQPSSSNTALGTLEAAAATAAAAAASTCWLVCMPVLVSMLAAELLLLLLLPAALLSCCTRVRSSRGSCSTTWAICWRAACTCATQQHSITQHIRHDPGPQNST